MRGIHGIVVWTSGLGCSQDYTMDRYSYKDCGTDTKRMLGFWPSLDQGANSRLPRRMKNDERLDSTFHVPVSTLEIKIHNRKSNDLCYAHYGFERE